MSYCSSSGFYAAGIPTFIKDIFRLGNSYIPDDDLSQKLRPQFRLS
jgi:hypothetical protein